MWCLEVCFQQQSLRLLKSQWSKNDFRSFNRFGSYSLVVAACISAPDINFIIIFSFLLYSLRPHETNLSHNLTKFRTPTSYSRWAKTAIEGNKSSSCHHSSRRAHNNSHYTPRKYHYVQIFSIHYSPFQITNNIEIVHILIFRCVELLQIEFTLQKNHPSHFLWR